MKFENLKQLVKVEKLLLKYCPDVTNVKHKLRGVDGNKKPITFTEQDKKAIAAGLAKFGKQIADISFIMLLFS